MITFIQDAFDSMEDFFLTKRKDNSYKRGFSDGEKFAEREDLRDEYEEGFSDGQADYWYGD